MLWAWLPRKSGGAIQGRIQDFPNWGVETHDTKSGEGGGSVRFRPDTKRGRGVLYTSECGGRLLREDAGGTFYERGGLQPPTPPPPPLPGATGRSVIGDINYALMAPPNSCAALFVPEADTGFSVRE